MLGYESVAELLSVSRVLGIFAEPGEQARMVQLIQGGEERPGAALLRRKDGGPHASCVIGTVCKEKDLNAVALVALEALNAACSDDKHSG
jgi:hypothetical protein